MDVDIGPDYEVALAKWAEVNNIPLKDAIKAIVRTEIAEFLPPFEPTTDFERRLRAMGQVGGRFSATKDKYSREEIYEE